MLPFTSNAPVIYMKQEQSGNGITKASVSTPSVRKATTRRPVTILHDIHRQPEMPRRTHIRQSPNYAMGSGMVQSFPLPILFSSVLKNCQRFSGATEAYMKRSSSSSYISPIFRNFAAEFHYPTEKNLLLTEESTCSRNYSLPQSL